MGRLLARRAERVERPEDVRPQDLLLRAEGGRDARVPGEVEDPVGPRRGDRGDERGLVRHVGREPRDVRVEREVPDDAARRAARDEGLVSCLDARAS